MFFLEHSVYLCVTKYARHSSVVSVHVMVTTLTTALYILCEKYIHSCQQQWSCCDNNAELNIQIFQLVFEIHSERCVSPFFTSGTILPIL